MSRAGSVAGLVIDFLKRPSLLISGSGGRPARKALPYVARLATSRAFLAPSALSRGALSRSTCRQVYPLPRARFFGVSRFRNRASKKKKKL